MIIPVTVQMFPFPTKSDLGAEMQPLYAGLVRGEEPTTMPIEMILKDRELLSHMIKLKAWFEISPEDMAEIKEKDLIFWPVTEQLFKIKEVA